MKYVPTFESFIGSHKLNENQSIMDTLGDYGWDTDEHPEIVKKYAPIVKALKAPDMWECVFWVKVFLTSLMNKTQLSLLA